MAVHDRADGIERFTCHRQLAPMLWALMAIGMVEIGVVHLLVAQWSVPVALALSVLSAATLLYLAALIGSFKRLPVEVSDEGVRVRTGTLIDAFVPFDEIAAVRSGFTGPARAPDLLKASLLAYPNATIELRRALALPGPFGRRRPVRAVALAVDEPARFFAAISARLEARPSP